MTSVLMLLIGKDSYKFFVKYYMTTCIFVVYFQEGQQLKQNTEVDFSVHKVCCCHDDVIVHT